MGKRVVLKLDGDFEQQGFRVALEIAALDRLNHPAIEVTGYLPPNRELMIQLEQWQQNYRRLLPSTRSIKPHRVTYGGSINPVDSCRRSAQTLEHQLQNWLKSESFQNVNLRLREALNPQEPIQVLIRSQDSRLSQLPWHKWDFIDRYSQAEIAFSSPDFEQITSATIVTAAKVKILAILGNSLNIDTQIDRQFLESLPNADVTFLVEPERQQINDRLWEQPWDILFFAGHSSSQDSVQAGRIFINAWDSLSIEDLRYGLKRAIAQGLQLAIFNSCDGLGLARSLADLHIPHLIVMREPVPDRVAQQFLLYFLNAFAGNQSFHLAVRAARERLQGLEDHFPCASWLPVIYQTPTAPELTWRSLLQPSARLRCHHTPPRFAFALSGLFVCVALLARLSGVLQPLELSAFDQLMRLRPDRGQDDRLLIVTITEADVAAQPSEQRRGASLSDRNLDQLLQRLQSYRPRAIGLDLYRDFAADAPPLAKRLQDDRLITLCSFGKTQGNLGIAPPPEIPAARQLGSVGFSSTPPDFDDRIRRHLLMQSPPANSICPANYSFGLLTALRYLEDEGIHLEWTAEELPRLKIGDTLFTPLEGNSGGYRSIDARGHQILLNYRPAQDGVARTVTLAQVLQGAIDPAWVKDRIVLIGNTDASFRDVHLTPYSRDSREKMPGVEIQAHMISQILSVVLDKQPLLQPWSAAGDLVWIMVWSIAGGAIVWRFTSAKQLLIGSGAIVLLIGGCYVLLLRGNWVPLVPAAFALSGTIAAGSIVQRYSHKLKD
ncbi:CHASE2 domain-containing protein [Microcoleus sp. FACHB-1515]|uniref:CHASE2 domain-containing protein n=1 Tax=Cyanophyceae TaxID=3028117 RepID=UPI0016846E28|nr:CHASE2 domain-containing protein [Microcoleus sp. FACHB-1515]MBD2092538.1 CHASE2 domain-containing protein [Microcoleus sp. FACHB-1515]